MTSPLQWTDVHTELKDIYSDMDRIQASLFTKCMKVKNLMHELEDTIKAVEHQISMQEASDDEKAHAVAR